jgi:oxygen-dependent protoporphyrinogen oxidase
VTRRIAIVGGGITGLAAAHRLGELAAAASSPPPELAVFEARPRAGGIVSTVHEGALTFEEGPDSFITDKPEALALLTRLGLQGRVRGTRPEFRRSFVVRNGRPVATPEGFYLLAPTRLGPVFTSPLFSPLGKLRMALEPFVPPRAPRGEDDDESLASFVTRRLGQETLERIAQAMVGGIYGAAPEDLSLGATFPRFLALERQYGSVIRGLKKTRPGATAPPGVGTSAAGVSGPRYGLFATLEGGLQGLTDALASRLPAGTLRLGTAVESAAPAPGGSWSVAAGGRAPEAFDALILALPAAGAARLVMGFDPALAGALAAFTSGSSVTLSLAYPETAIAHPLDGAGLVVPRAEGPALSGLIGLSFTHRKFEQRAPEGIALLRLFFDEAALGLEDDALAARGHAAVAALLGASQAPVARHAARWPGGMPRYRVGHRARVRAARALAARHPGLALAGNSYEGVGLPDCVRDGEAVAAAIFEGYLRRD